MEARNLKQAARRRSNSRSIALLTAGLCFPALPARLGAQIVPLGGEIAISPVDTHNEYSSRVATDRQGGWGVTWRVSNYDFVDQPQRMRRVGRDGNLVASTLREHDLLDPDLGLDGAGNGVVVGQRARPELGGFEIDALCLDRLGRPRAERVRVDAGAISPATRVPGAARVAVDSDGTFAVVWMEQPRLAGVPTSVFFRRFDAGCRALGNVQSLASVGEVGRRDPHIATRTDGGLVLAWLEAEGEGVRVRAQLFDREGSPIAPSFAASEKVIWPYAGPTIAVSSSGSFAIYWPSDPISPRLYEIAALVRVFSIDGSPLGSEYMLNQPQHIDAFSGGVAAVDGAFVAVWGENGYFEQGSAVYARAFDERGPIGSAFRLNVSHTDPGEVRIAASGGTEFVVVWDDLAENTLPPDVVGRRFAFLPEATGCIASSTALCLGGGRFRVTVEWRDFQGNRGAGHTRDLTDDSGLFWFFDDANLEMLVKMVDGCAQFSRHWFFAAATTNVEYTLRVTDTETGRSRSYFNRQGVSSPAITDTDAFSDCP